MSGDRRVIPFPDADNPQAEPEREVPDGLVGAVEALLFASGEPVRLEALCAALDDTPPDEVRRALEVLAWRREAPGSGLQVARIGGGWQLRTRPRYAQEVMRLRGGRPRKLSRPALEVLAVVAWRQPVTKAEIEAVRGVDSGGVLKTLLDRELVRVAGRRDEPGRPLQYATTQAFLEMFSLPSLSALPTLREREELVTDLGLTEE